MSTLRFLAALFALVAILALVADATPRVTGTGEFRATSIGAHWKTFSPTTLAGAQDGVTRQAGPAVWRAVEGTLLAMPTFALFAGLALISGYAGRHRRRVNIYVN